MPTEQDSYSERIYPSAGVTLALLALDSSIVFAIWASLDEAFAIVTASVALSLSILWWLSAIARIEVRAGKLRVNQAEIDIGILTAVQVLKGDSWRRSRGSDFDPRLFHAHKFWMKSGVELTLNDVRDPHPGWLVGSNRCDELGALLLGMISKD